MIELMACINFVRNFNKKMTKFKYYKHEWLHVYICQRLFLGQGWEWNWWLTVQKAKRSVLVCVLSVCLITIWWLTVQKDIKKSVLVCVLSVCLITMWWLAVQKAIKKSVLVCVLSVCLFTICRPTDGLRYIKLKDQFLFVCWLSVYNM